MPCSPLNIGDQFPNFEAETSVGKIDFYDWMNDSWAILFSHPADFTPVCTTELARVAALIPEFLKRGVKPIALSCDTVESHKGWIEDIKSFGTCVITHLSHLSEILRVIDSLQLTQTKSVATPADWQQGGKCMVLPTVKGEDVPNLFPKGIETIEVPSGKGYLRTTPQP
ncbi:GL26709 [Drosophila persimilis]|uniref:thioredoxin-dependent peroxiredoxin n=1 Tax=Drosophila persimilis TaxID=7234 RepID=B4GSB5_DROPE|nr:GL26709 [Drosophila persimilis]